MLALGMWEATRCPVCGGDREECWAEENEGKFKMPKPWPMRCHRETALAKARKEYSENPHPAALVFRAELI